MCENIFTHPEQFFSLDGARPAYTEPIGANSLPLLQTRNISINIRNLPESSDNLEIIGLEMRRS